MNINNINEFSDELKACLEKYVSKNETVKINSLWKNNGIQLVGVSIMEEGRNIAPTFYLEEYFENFQNGKSLETIATEIISLNEKYRVDHLIEIDFFMDYSKAKEKIAFRLINKKLNATLLKKIPHIEYMDLAIVFYYLLEHESFGSGTILIHDSHLSMWKITKDKLYEDAYMNTPKLLPAQFYEIKTVLYEMATSIQQRAFLEQEFEGCDIPMYVLSNNSKVDGAAVLLYENELENIAKKLGDSFYVIPSSIHELLIVPQKHADPVKLNDMVNEVNKTQLDPREILAEHVYFYDMKDEKLISCDIC